MLSLIRRGLKYRLVSWIRQVLIISPRTAMQFFILNVLLARKNTGAREMLIT